MIIINGKVYRNLQEQVQKNMEDIEDLKKFVLHDMLLNVESDTNVKGNVHIVFYDTYDKAYTLDKLKNTFRGDFHPISYGRNVNSVIVTNNTTRVYMYFRLVDNTLTFEEQEDYYGGSTYIEESINTYNIIACNDKITKL